MTNTMEDVSESNTIDPEIIAEEREVVRRIETRRQEFQRRAIELYIWIFVAFLFVIPNFYSALQDSSKGILGALLEESNALILALFVTLIPVVCNLIFGHLPLGLLRRYLERRRNRTASEVGQSMPGSYQDSESSFPHELERQSSPPSGDQLLDSYAKASARIADSLYQRAGVYLLIGALVAFSGLVFFYSQIPKESVPKTDVTDKILNLAPNFGVLFFIEFIAFFFLRQYRSAMDEFRYFEAVKRRREELLAMIRLNSENGNTLDLPDFVKNGMFYSSAGKLYEGESTEIIESRKLEKDELAVFQKMVEVIGKQKG